MKIEPKMYKRTIFSLKFVLLVHVLSIDKVIISDGEQINVCINSKYALCIFAK